MSRALRRADLSDIDATSDPGTIVVTPSHLYFRSFLAGEIANRGVTRLGCDSRRRRGFGLTLQAGHGGVVIELEGLLHPILHAHGDRLAGHIHSKQFALKRVLRFALRAGRRTRLIGIAVIAG